MEDSLLSTAYIMYDNHIGKTNSRQALIKLKSILANGAADAKASFKQQGTFVHLEQFSEKLNNEMWYSFWNWRCFESGGFHLCVHSESGGVLNACATLMQRESTPAHLRGM